MQRAVSDTVRYTRERKAFGHSLFDFQNTLRAGRVPHYRHNQPGIFDYCIDRHLRGELDAARAAMLKYWLTDRLCEVVDRCVQLHGGYGYMREYLIARMYEDTRVQRIYAAANEVTKSIIASHSDTIGCCGLRLD